MIYIFQFLKHLFGNSNIKTGDISLVKITIKK